MGNNWSIGTNTGLNFFYPGKTDDARKLFVTGIACLAHGLMQHNELVRCAVAHAGNDHRLGAQEAPPAIISLYPGTGFEAHLSSLIEGGKSHRDAVAQMYKDNRNVIFTGNGYSAEWPVEAQKRGLPNLTTTPMAVATFNNAESKKVFTE